MRPVCSCWRTAQTFPGKRLRTIIRAPESAGTSSGATVGALHGREALPDRWIENLTGRVTYVGDDDSVFELVEEARDRWWDSA